MAATSHQVAVLGASRNRQRYANRAVRALQQHGYDVVPINPAHDEIEGLPVVPDVGRRCSAGCTPSPCTSGRAMSSR